MCATPKESAMTDFVMDADKFLSVYLIPMAWKVAGAIVLWVVGGWVIGWISRLSSNGMTARKVDPTLIRYADAAIRVILRIVLVIAILAVFGIETTSFAALLAAAGIAIGAAWAGLLSNFAAGIFLIILRPFKVGDMITAGGITGDVREIGLFATAVDTVDNLRVYVGNSKILADNVVNYTQNEFRRVDLKAQIAHTVDPKDAIAKLSARIKQIPNVVKTPEPQVEIIEFNPAGAMLGVRPFCHNNHYWQVYFDTNKAIQEVCTQAGYPVPAPHTVLVQKSSG
jgi:small conductance mechanosensitive channel